MEPQDRIKYLRKKILNMSQEKFANEIHISRSNLGNIETSKIGLTNRVIADICHAFHVNSTWITSGQEPIFERNDDGQDKEILDIYSRLSETNKKYLVGYIHRLLEEQNGNI